MKKAKTPLMITSVLLMLVIWGFIALEKGTDLLKGIDLIVFILIVAIGAIALFLAYKRQKEEKEGQPKVDEMTLYIKYKTGYYAFMASMYMWLFIFIFKDKFPDTETMLGGGILLSALIFYISKLKVKKELNDK